MELVEAGADAYNKRKTKEKKVKNRSSDVYDVMNQVNQVIFGKEREVREIMLALLANGHVLLEDIPGVGKTTLALAFSRTMELEYHRIQFTPDVLPSDLTGFSIYHREKEKFVYQQGAVFCNLLLADEINRTSPKTQSALLEVMEERKVTVEEITREVPSPFLVIATQNPFGSAGTSRLPEAQVDRFMVSMSVGYPDYDSELAMVIGERGEKHLEKIRPVFGGQELLEIQEEVHHIYVKERVGRYLVDLVRATRESRYLERGGSPRATIALVRMAQASAWLDQRDYVIPEDISSQFPFVMRHRILLSSAAGIDGKSVEEVLEDIVSSVKKPAPGEDK